MPHECPHDCENMRVTGMTAYEMTLDEILSDPVTRLVMRRDGVSEDEIRDLMTRTQRNRRAAH